MIRLENNRSLLFLIQRVCLLATLPLVHDYHTLNADFVSFMFP